jgi:hypothetical protein
MGSGHRAEHAHRRVVWAVLSVRFRTPKWPCRRAGLLEKLAALTPGGADVLIRGLTGLARRLGRAD